MAAWVEYNFIAPTEKHFLDEFILYWDKAQGKLSHPYMVFECALPVIIQPAMFDEEGDVIDAPVMSPYYHAKIRVYEGGPNLKERRYLTDWRDSYGLNYKVKGRGYEAQSILAMQNMQSSHARHT